MKKHLFIGAVLVSFTVPGFAQQTPAPAAPAVTAPAAPAVTAPVAPAVTAPAAPVINKPAAPVVNKAAAPVVNKPAAPVVSPARKSLTELNDKETAEIKALDESAKAARQKHNDQIKAAENTLKADLGAIETQKAAVYAKYAPDRYSLMDQITPGSGARRAQFDKARADLGAQRTKDLETLDAAKEAGKVKGQITKDAMLK